MSNPYEVEHNIKPGASRGSSRRVDMSSFQSFLSQLTTTQPASAPEQHNNPHATPTPVDTAALFQLVQQQMQTLFSTAPTDSNRDFLEGLVHALESDIDHPPTEIAGVSQEFLAELDRVDRRKLKTDDACPICAERFLDDKYCLVVELPCHKSHRFDLECVSAWLLSKGNCPMCRTDLTKKKQPVIVDDSEEDEDPDGLYA